MNASDNVWLSEYEGLVWPGASRSEPSRRHRDDAPDVPDYVTVAPHFELAAQSAGKPAPQAFLE